MQLFHWLYLILFEAIWESYRWCILCNVHTKRFSEMFSCERDFFYFTYWLNDIWWWEHWLTKLLLLASIERNNIALCTHTSSEKWLMYPCPYRNKAIKQKKRETHTLTLRPHSQRLSLSSNWDQFRLKYYTFFICQPNAFPFHLQQIQLLSSIERTIVRQYNNITEGDSMWCNWSKRCIYFAQALAHHHQTTMRMTTKRLQREMHTQQWRTRRGIWSK